MSEVQFFPPPPNPPINFNFCWGAPSLPGAAEEGSYGAQFAVLRGTLFHQWWDIHRNVKHGIKDAARPSEAYLRRRRCGLATGNGR